MLGLNRTPQAHRARIGVVRAVTLVLALMSSACAPVLRTLRGYADVPTDPRAASPETDATGLAPRWLAGQHRLLLDDFGSLDTDRLNTYAVPWKVASAALVLRRVDRDGAPLSATTLHNALREFGFLFPARIENWIGPQPPPTERPTGLLAGLASRRMPRIEIEVAGFGCAACHAGVTYDSAGYPTRNAWLGLPNTSLDVSAYGDSLYAALHAAVRQPARLTSAIRTLYPEVSAAELSTIERHVIPRARARTAPQGIPVARALPFDNGGPGVNNGVASLRHQLNQPVHAPSDRAFVSIPFIGDRHLRSSMTTDGTFGVPGTRRFAAHTRVEVRDTHLDALAGIVALFTVPTQGVSPAIARRAIPAMGDVMRYVSVVRAPPFPGRVDSALALDGERVYRAACAECHGTMSRGLRDVRLEVYPNVLVPGDEIGTDPSRWQAADGQSLRRIRSAGFAKWIDAAPTRGYVAPPLTGVWATAPYLHNGSVPTLWHLLHPSKRPTRFEVGGHALDFERVGIAGALAPDGVYRYRPGYTPWARPAVYDTRERGRSNRGHEAQVERLTRVKKRAVLEYLKVL